MKLSGKKPNENLQVNDGQKGINQCKECSKVYMSNWEDAVNEDFCSEECKDHFEAKSKPDIADSPLEDSKDVIMQNDDSNDTKRGNHFL